MTVLQMKTRKAGNNYFSLCTCDSYVNSTVLYELCLSPRTVPKPTSGPRPIGSTLIFAVPLTNKSR